MFPRGEDMKNVIHRNETRGRAHHGWLKSHHTFSFADYFRPDRMNFGALRVLNDDEVDPGKGFLTHPHKNMEIVTIPLSGALRHRDSTGREAVIRHGEVQIMSAGSGIAHSEVNASEEEPVTLLQIWVLPEEIDISPRYDQAVFSPDGRRNRFQTVVAPTKEEGALWINQDAFFSLADIGEGETVTYRRKGPGNGIYLFVIEGGVEVGGEKLNRRDAAGFEGKESLAVKAMAASQVLVIEVPMELPN
jgi:redox-sensitive bicupin YhaK (pirin superfamily)